MTKDLVIFILIEGQLALMNKGMKLKEKSPKPSIIAGVQVDGAETNRFTH